MKANYYIVARILPCGKESLAIGTPVDVSGWRNVRSLLEAGYLRKPNTIEDWDAIQNIIERHKEVEQVVEESKKTSQRVRPVKPA